MYKVRYTETNNQTATEYETRSLLYLLAMKNNCDKLSIFFIDCFNDVTGTDDDFESLYDAQSKGVASLYPTTIGESLITLFENHSSDLNFIESFLILPKLKDGYLIDNNKQVYGFDNFIEDKRRYLINGLENEYLRRRKINQISIKTKEQIIQFVNEVKFIVALEKDEYIREIVEFKNKEKYSVEFYTSIFDEIRDFQSVLKNINIEGIEITEPQELIEFKKHIKSTEVRLMVLNRFVGTELFKNNYIPVSYYQELSGLEQDDIKDLIQDNNSDLSRAFFNKNNKKNFWLLLENIIEVLSSNKKQQIRTVHSKINPTYIHNNYPLDENSLLFFIAIIKDGLYDN